MIVKTSIPKKTMSVGPIGSTLSEMAVRSDPTKDQTRISGPKISARILPHLGDSRSDAPEQVDSIAEIANNVIGRAEIRDTGVTGEMFSNCLVPTIEQKGDWTEFM